MEMNENCFASVPDLRVGLKTAGTENPRKLAFSTKGSRIGTTVEGRRPRALIFQQAASSLASALDFSSKVSSLPKQSQSQNHFNTSAYAMYPVAEK